MTHPTLAHYLVVAVLLFGFGLVAAVTRRSAIGMLLGIALILNAAALNFVAFEHFLAPAKIAGQAFALLSIVFAAAETAIALAVVLQVYRTHRTIAADELTELRD